MKDFNEFLKEDKHYSDKVSSGVLPPTNVKEAEKALDRQILKDKVIKLISPVLLSLLTSPMQVASIYMQMSPKALANPIQDKLALQKQRNLQVEPRYIANGIYGDNKIYQPQEIRGYRHAFQRLGQQGLLGYYKGNLTQLVLTSVNSSIRVYLISLLAQQKYSEGITNGLSILLCSAADALTTPLMTIQSRLILQNRLPNFRTYKNPFSILRTVPVRQLFRGWLVHFPKNLAMIFSWLNLVKQSPLYSFIVSSALAHLTTYPFTTVMRVMQVQSNDQMMLGKVFSNSWQCAKHLWRSSGLKGFYRGFGCYAVVHSFTTALMVQINMRSGFFMPV